MGLALAAPWYAAITARLGGEYWQQALGYHVLARIARPLEGHSSCLGPLYWPLQIGARLATLAPLVVLGMGRAGARRVLEAADRRLLWSWLLVSLVLFSGAATKYHPYVLLFLPPLAVFAALGFAAFLAGEISRPGAVRVLVAAVACLVWAQTSPLRRAAEQIACALARGATPPGAGVLAAGGFLGASVLAAVILGRVLGRRSGDVRSPVWRRALAAIVLVPAAAGALAPQLRRGSEWQRMARCIETLEDRRIEAHAPRAPIDDLYLDLLAARGVDVRRDVVPAATPSPRAP